MIRFNDLHLAYLAVSAAGPYENAAYVCKDSDEIVCVSEGDRLEGKDQDVDTENCLAIPNKHDLDLGHHLVFEFVEARMPDDYDRVRRIFQKRGAYGRYKDLLDRRGLLQAWYDFQNQREEAALRAWCKENGITLSD